MPYFGGGYWFGLGGGGAFFGGGGGGGGTVHENVERLYDQFQFRLSASYSTSSTGDVTATYGAQAYLDQHYIRTISLQESFVYIGWELGDFELAFTETPGGTVRTIPPTTGTEGILEFDDLELVSAYDSSGPSWSRFVRWSAARFICDGVTISTWAGSQFDCVGFGPGWTPFVNPAEILADGGINISSGGTSYETTISIEFVGGYRFKEPGAADWSYHPVQLPPITPASLADAFVADDSWNCGGTWSETLSTTDGEVTYFTEIISPRLFVVPNLDKSMVKLGHDYAALVQRAAFPDATAMTYDISGPWDFAPPTPDPSDITYPLVYAGAGAALNRVSAATHGIEVPLETTSYLMAACGFISGTTNVSGTVSYYEFPHHVQRGSEYAGEAGYLSFDDGDTNFYTHTDAILLANSWYNPHWLYWFHGRDWDADGGAQDYNDYWAVIGDQHLTHPSLDPSEDTAERTSNVSASLTDSMVAPWFEANVFPKQSGWWGHGYVVRDTPTYPASLPADAGPNRWTVTGATATWNAGDVKLSPSGAGTVTVDYDLSNWFYEPYLYPSLAKEFELTWTGGTITTTSIKLLGVDGREIEIGDTTGTFTYPAKGLTAEKYAGTWGHTDFGVGEITDDPDDATAGGDSDATFLNSTTAINMLRLPLRSAKTLRIEFEVTSAADITLDYPVFHRAATWKVFSEGRQYQAMLSDSGTYARFGSSWFSTVPPIIRNLGSKSVPADWHYLRNYALKGADDTGIATELTDAYGADVENAQLIAWVWANTAGPVGMGVETLQFPVMGAFAPIAFDSEFEDTTSHDMRAIDYSERARYLLTSSVQNQMSFDGLTMSAGEPIGGWNVRAFVGAVDGTETCSIRIGGVEVAVDARPWHGFLGIYGVDTIATGLRVSMDVNRGWTHARAYTDGTGIAITGSAGNELTWVDAATTVSADDLSIAIAPTGLLRSLLVATGGAVTLYSSDDGVTWTSVGAVGSGERVAVVLDNNQVQYLYWLDGTDIKGQIRDAAGNVVTATFTAQAGVDADSDVDADGSVNLSGQHRIVLQGFVGGSVTTWTSDDGVTF